MAEFEYMMIDLCDRPRKTTELDLLNTAGERGWELVAIMPNNTAYLKREITKKAPTSVRRRAETVTTKKRIQQPQLLPSIETRF